MNLIDVTCLSKIDIAAPETFQQWNQLWTPDKVLFSKKTNQQLAIKLNTASLVPPKSTGDLSSQI